MPTSELDHFYWSHWRTASGAVVHATVAEPDRFNFLSFLATAQAARIELLRIVWDAGRGVVGFGGTSRIEQALVNLDTSFAFKTYHKQRKSEEQVFQTLINEITVLSEPFVRKHANIAQLQGICWDIAPSDDKPWPVLVFEKSHLGDLLHFATHEGRSILVDERVGLCLDIGRAIADMHANRIIHGDIKPENVLVFRDQSGRHYARVIDFGYSTRYIRHDQSIVLARSEPWNAPENNGHRSEWTPSQAEKADLYCYGVLCLWLLFEPHFEGDALLRKKGELQALAQQLLTEETALGSDKKSALRQLFDLSLRPTPEQREGSLEAFLGRLDPQRMNPEAVLISTNLEDATRGSDFKIEKSIYDLYNTDYRVRYYIAQCLLDCRSQAASLALQVALCHFIGFGIIRDEAKAKEILAQDPKSFQNIQDIVSTLQEDLGVYKAPTISELSALDQVRWTDFSYIYLEQGKVDEAEAQITQEMDDLTVVFGDDHGLVDLSRSMLGHIYRLQGRWKEAEKLLQHVMEVEEKKFGSNHPNMLETMAQLASTYRNQGRWEDAEKLEVQVVLASKLILGENNPKTLMRMANYALTLWNWGRREEAQKLEARIVELNKAKFGVDHPSTLTSMANLGSTLSSQGQWEEAEKLEAEVVEISKAKLGANHPSTLTCTANLASTYRRQGRFKEAEELFSQVAETQTTHIGPDHPSTLSSKASLALTYRNQGRWEEAETLFLHVVEKQKAKLGPDHPSTLASMANLASTYRNQGRYGEAENLLDQVIETQKAKLGEDHPNTLSSLTDLASTYMDQGRWEEAEKLYKQILEKGKTNLGAHHFDMMASQANLVVLYMKQARWNEAEELSIPLVETYKTNGGEHHPKTLVCTSNLASIYMYQGRWKDAETLQVQVVASHKAKLGPEHPNTLHSMMRLASTYRNQGRLVEAENLEAEVMRI